jgi:hypothetical protein
MYLTFFLAKFKYSLSHKMHEISRKIQESYTGHMSSSAGGIALRSHERQRWADPLARRTTRYYQFSFLVFCMFSYTLKHIHLKYRLLD